MADKNRTRSAVCVACEKMFEYRVGRGSWRTHCLDLACKRERQRRTREALKRESRTCSTLGCEGKATRIGVLRCEVCYYRMRRTGTTAARKRNGSYLDKQGYRHVRCPEHPMARPSSGFVYEHRAILYDSVLGLSQPCTWCGKPLGWNETAVDHLNEKKADNNISNLVPSCGTCNLARGAMAYFVIGLTDSGWDLLVKTFASLRNIEMANDADATSVTAARR